ncbi:MAG TPA: hypothetical protein VHR47_06700, partial [Bacillota bacterium]|nr:hypothetical protein [Bacillota bacterium]
MSKPLAIYASIPADHQNSPVWDRSLGTPPVTYRKPNPKWPNLDWRNNPLEDYQPKYYSEAPHYLWAKPQVTQPVKGENHTFIRRWQIGEADSVFNSKTIPQLDIILLILHAADDLYSMGLFLGDVQNGELLNPLGANGAAKNAWRNIKSYLYHLNLESITPGTELN